MRLDTILRTACAGTLTAAVFANVFTPVYIRQQASSAPTLPSGLPVLTSSSPASSGGVSSASNTPASTGSVGASATGSSLTSATSFTASPSPTSQTSSSSNHPPASSTVASTTATPPSSTVPAPAPTSTAKDQDTLPLSPAITPALSLAGVILIATGVVHALIGIKHRWIHTFLSCSYLASLSITVLIIYVMTLPVNNAVQGAYFVAIFMIGIIIGGGSLIFKEVMEAFGCLLGGFCVAMWLLTLKPGGVIQNSAGKGIFVGVSCLICLTMYLFPSTRNYGLIGSTSFAGATALVLGIDCFSRAGYKEFWLYVWNLNPNLFPLNTSTYPLTRGIRVELIAIVIASIIGIMSQIKLWKVIRDRRKQKEEERQAEEERRDAVDEALGRRLERQTSRARVEWEKIYGEHGAASRTSVVESTIGTEDILGRMPMSQRRPVSVYAPQDVEMRRVLRRSTTWDPRTMRQSMVTIVPIQEDEEPAEQAATVRSPVVEEPRHSANNPAKNSESGPGDGASTADKRLSSDPPTDDDTLPTEVSRDASVADGEEEHKKPGKRESVQSLWKRLSGHQLPQSSFGRSEEALIVPSVHHSRASSLAATVDGEQEIMDMISLRPLSTSNSRLPDILVSPANTTLDDQLAAPTSPGQHSVPPSPPALSVNYSIDLEELPRLARFERIAAQLGSSKDLLPTVSEPAESAGNDTPKPDLTTSALENVPNHVSNVVLTYRTNEWAKHADKADEPVYDEPEQMATDVPDETPARVLDSIAKIENAIEDVVAETPVERSIPSPQLSASIKSPPSDIKPVDTTSGPRAVEPRSISEQMRANASTGDLSSPESSVSAVPRGFRSASSPMVNHLLVSSPIDENAKTTFSPTQQAPMSPPPSSTIPSVIGTHSASRLSTAGRPGSSAAMRPGSSAGVHTLAEAIQRSQARSSLSGGNDTRPLSQRSNSLRPLMAADTRLTSYDSRQPVRQSSAPDAGRRETMLADWRTSIRQDVHGNATPAINIEESRAAMLMNKSVSRQTEQQVRQVKDYNQQVMDQAMRRSDMQELHREALRRMQAKANQHAR